ncbi:MAG: DDE-type integrase/transposase/recombinase, partial [Angustibacter sp.]
MSDETAYGTVSEGLRGLVAKMLEHDPLAREVLHYRSRAEPVEPGDRGQAGGRSQERKAKHFQERWHEQDGLLYHEQQLYIPPGGGARNEVLQRHHDDPLAGHFAAKKTLDLIRRKYYWPGMAKTIRDYVGGCAECHRIKAPRHKPHGELQSLPLPSGPYTDITMDFITDLPPSTKGGKVYDSILVVVDRYTKMARYIPVRKTLDAPGLAQVIVSKHILAGAGAPRTVVSDRGTIFTAEFWSALCYHLKIHHRYSTAFHPQTDGQTERQNQTLEQYLRAYINYQQDDWVRWLRMAEFADNNARHSSTGVSPFFALTGRNAELNPELAPRNPEVPAAKARAEALQSMRADLEARLAEAAKTQAHYADRKTKARSYSVGDLVYLSGKNIRTKRPSSKLDYKYHGPFEVTAVVGRQAYRLDLKEAHKGIHPVFHVSLLEPCKRRDGEDPPEPPPLLVDGEEQYRVEKILDSRVRYGKLAYKVRWEGYSDTHDQWVGEDDLNECDEIVEDFHRKNPLKPRAGAGGPTKGKRGDKKKRWEA